MSKRWNEVRDALLFLGGLAGVFHETVVQTGERPTLLILFAAMMGLPAFLRADAIRQGTGVPPDQLQSPSQPPPQQPPQPPVALPPASFPPAEPPPEPPPQEGQA